MQVDATPKHNRIKTDVAVTPQARRQSEPATVASASSLSAVPSSGIRLRSPMNDHEDTDVPQTGHRIHVQTIPDTTPVKPIKFAIPTVPASVSKKISFAHEIDRAIFETPVKAASKPPIAQETPKQPETPVGKLTTPDNIYDALGWD